MSEIVGTVTAGISTTEGITDTNLVLDIQRDVTRYNEISHPLFNFFTRQAGRVIRARQPLFNWQENQMEYGKFEIAAGIAAKAAGVNQSVVIDYPAMQPGDMFIDSKLDQQFIVDEVTSRNSTSSTCTVRQIPLANATLAVAGPAVIVPIGTALVEAGWFPNATGSIPKRLSNICGAVAKSVQISKIAQYSETYYGPQWEEDKRAVITQYRKDLERMFLFSKQVSETGFTQENDQGSMTNWLRVSRGVIPHLSSNIGYFTGSVTDDTIDNFLGNQTFKFKYSGNSWKLGLLGPTFIDQFNRNVKATKLRVIDASESEYGLDMQIYRFHGGRKIMFMEESEFWEYPRYMNSLLCVDPDKIFLHQLGPNFMEIVHSSHPQQHAEMISIVSILGVECKMEQAHSLLLGPQ